MNRERYEELYSEFKPKQRIEEFFLLINLIEKYSPKIILEIGVGYGGSLKFWEEIIPEDGLVIGIDIRGRPLNWDYRHSSKKVILIKGDSHKEETKRKLLEILDSRKIDLMFHDGDHTYEGAKKDFEMYSVLVKKDGIVCYADIEYHPRRLYPNYDVGVYRFWQELKETYGTQTAEYVIKERHEKRFAGFGVLFFGSKTK